MHHGCSPGRNPRQLCMAVLSRLLQGSFNIKFFPRTTTDCCVVWGWATTIKKLHLCFFGWFDIFGPCLGRSKFQRNELLEKPKSEKQALWPMSRTAGAFHIQRSVHSLCLGRRCFAKPWQGPSFFRYFYHPLRRSLQELHPPYFSGPKPCA